MSVPILPPYSPAFDAAPNVTPFTYRDGLSYVQKFEKLKQWINLTILPYVNEHFVELYDEFERQVNLVITEVNTALATQGANNLALLAAQDAENTAAFEAQDIQLSNAITDLTALVDAAVASVINQTIAITDPVMTGVANNTASTFYAQQSLEIKKGVTVEAIAGLKVINYDKLSRFREKLSRASITPVNIVFLGDSITEGVGTDDTGDSTGTNSIEKRRERAYPVIVRKRFCSRGNVPPTHDIVLLTTRAAMLTSSGYSTSTSIGPFGGMFGTAQLGSASQSIVLPAANTGKFTELDVYWWGSDSGVAGKKPGIKIDDVEVQVGGATDTGWLKKATFTGLSDAAHKVELTSTSTGGVFPAYIGLRRSDSKVRVNRIAVAGATSVDAVGTNQRNIDAAVMKDHSDLVCIMLGTNDHGGQIALATFKANIQSLITSAAAGGADVLLLGAPPASTGSTTTITEDQYRSTMLDLSNENANVAYVDTRVLYGNNNRTAAYAAGLFPTSGTVHPSRLGHEKMGNAIFEVISAIGITSIN